MAKMVKPVESDNETTNLAGAVKEQNVGAGEKQKIFELVAKTQYESKEEKDLIAPNRFSDVLAMDINAKGTNNETNVNQDGTFIQKTLRAPKKFKESNRKARSKKAYNQKELENGVDQGNQENQNSEEDNIKELPILTTGNSQQDNDGVDDLKNTVHDHLPNIQDNRLINSNDTSGEVKLIAQSNHTLDVPQKRQSRSNRKIGFEVDNKDDRTESIESQQKVPTHIAQKLRVIQCNATKQKLITLSQYNGVWRDSLQCMDGYGTYTYPDGSEYRGYFSRGHFNGYGTLHLAAPYNCSFKGSFFQGLMHEIEDMWFDDGLHVNASFEGWSADFSNWKYCCNEDRRFAAEQVEGLPAVGPYSFLTNNRPARKVGKNYFDLVEGFYGPSSGLIIARPKPFTSVSLPSKERAEWIVNNCRHGSGVQQEFPGAVWHKIIDNNLENELELEEQDPSCNYNQSSSHKRYFPKLSKDKLRNRSGGKISEDSVGLELPNSSSTYNSFTDRSLSVDVQEYLETGRQYGNMKLGRELESEQPSLMSRPFKRDSVRSSNISFR